jgi:hypothetical protein
LTRELPWLRRELAVLRRPSPILIVNAAVAAGALFVAVAAGGVAYVLAAPVVAISGGAVIWQIIHIVRTTRRGEFRHPIR